MWDRLLRKLKSDGVGRRKPREPEPEPEWEKPPLSVEEFVDRLQTVGLGEQADAFARLVRPSLRLCATDFDHDAADVGHEADMSHEADMGRETEAADARLGGRPTLAPDVDWPRRNDGAPLSLVAQVSLTRMAAQGHALPCPTDGTLAFFYDAVEQSVWGFSPSDSDGWAVVHCPSDSGSLRGYPDDLPDEGRFEPVLLTARRELTFPPTESFDVEHVTGEAWSRNYLPVLGEAGEDGTIHRFLGHPDPVQGDMQVECQLASNGVNVGTSQGYRSLEGTRLRPGATDWRLLLQIDSDDSAGMMWGDVGRLYWWIREVDLAAGRWDAAWFVLQCG